MAEVAYLAEGVGIIWHPAGERVLVSGGKLPRFSVPHSAYKGPGVAEALGAALGLRLHVLRRLSFTPVSAEPVRHDRYVFELEWLSGDLEGHEFADPRGLEPELGAGVLENLLATPSPLRPAWQRRGWRAETEGWLAAELSRLGLTRTGELELKHTWGISTLYAAPLSGGTAYLKAVPDFFAREVPLTAWLDRVLPGVGPGVLAADPPGRRLLLADAGQTAWMSPEADERVMKRLANLQRGTIGREGELLALGCEDRRLPVLLEHGRALLENDAAMGVGAAGGLTAAEADELRALGPRLWEMIARLEAFGLPATLIHGDLHLDNVATSAQGDAILDWSDGALAHPFMDAHPVYLLHDLDLGPEAIERLREAYLAAWTDLLPVETLREAFALAQPLAELYIAVSYARYIVPAVEDKGEWADAAPHHLRGVLRLARAMS